MRCAYHPDYFLPLPDGHPFPMEKFPEAHDLVKNQVDVIEIQPFPKERLTCVHDPDYLNRINWDDEIGQSGLTHNERKRLGLPSSPRLLNRSTLETSGTYYAAQWALEDGIAANLAGGTHHAFPDRGQGYCVLNDVAVTIQLLRQDQHRCQEMHYLVVDTDAHQGNGTNAIFQDDSYVTTFSIHVGKNYPSQKVPGDCDIELPRWVDGETYLQAMESTLPGLFQSVEPDLVFWISGADNHENDRFGQMKLTTENMRQRDRFILTLCQEFHVPTTVLYGGGYNQKRGMTAALHAQSILEAQATPIRLATVAS
ncbi:MAG: histone deacetylase [Verrucomicrobiota bacterium]